MNQSHTPHLLGVVASCALTAMHAQPVIAKQPSEQPAAEQRIDVQESTETVGAFLDRLHARHSTIDTLTARMIATTVYTLQGDLQTVRGSFAIQNEATAPNPEAGTAVNRRSIRVDFIDRITDGIIRDDRKSIVFDGEVLLEINHEDQQLIPRQIAPPGTVIDPLAVDGAMVPIPVGQTRAEIENAYDASFADVAQGLGDDDDLGYELEPVHLDTLRSWVADAVQVVLRPHEGSKALEFYSLIRAWYDRDTMLPVLVVLSTAEENYEVIQLDSHRVNDPAALTNPRAFITDVDQLRGDFVGWKIRPLDPYRGEIQPSSPAIGPADAPSPRPAADLNANTVTSSTRVINPASLDNPSEPANNDTTDTTDGGTP